MCIRLGLHNKDHSLTRLFRRHMICLSRMLLQLIGRPTFSAIALGIIFSFSPARADQAQTWCFTQEVGKAPTQLRRCSFSQRQGSARVYRGNIVYFFDVAGLGKSYDRINDESGIIFKSPRALLRVFWDRPCNEWKRCAGAD